jgi:hypothetical protein
LSKKGARWTLIDFIEILNKQRGEDRANFLLMKAKCPILSGAQEDFGPGSPFDMRNQMNYNEVELNMEETTCS